MGRSVKILVILLLLGGVAYLAYHRFMVWHSETLEEATTAEKTMWLEKTSGLGEEIFQLQNKLRGHAAALPDERLVETFGKRPTLPPKEGDGVNCEQLKKQIRSFFSYLDKQEYVRPYNWTGGVHEWSRKAVGKLSLKMPIVSGETADIYNLVKNMAHLYKTLGSKDVVFVKDVLVHESDIMEPTLALFYEWFSCGDGSADNLEVRLSGKSMYEYAGFFLNTLAGRSYLLRRNLKLQTLINYYALLVIHTANEGHQNKYGINIKPHIDRLLDNIQQQTGLTNQEHYLRKLAELMKIYEGR